MNGSPESKGSPGGSFLERYSVLIICVFLFVTPVLLYGAAQSRKVVANDINQWLPKGFREAETYGRFREKFGADEMVVASWDGCTMDNKMVGQFSRSLEELEVDGTPVFGRVISGPEILAQIRSMGTTEKAARHRIDQLLIGKDGETTCILAFPADVERSGRQHIMRMVYETAESSIGLSADQLILGGPTIDGATIDVESKRSLEQFMGITIAVVFFLTWFRLRDIRLSIIVLIFSVVCAATSLAVLFYTGGKMNLTMVMLPTLTFIMGVSSSVHMVNYYRKAAVGGDPEQAASRALRDGGLPIALSSFTTAVGMASLATSQVVPIRLFGLFSAAAIICALPVILLVMPAVLHLLKGRLSRHINKRIEVDRREGATGISRRSTWLMNRVCRNHWLLTIPAAVAMIVLGMGVFRIKASVKIQNRFASGTKIINDYAWLEENLGPLVPMEVVIKFNSDEDIALWEQLEIVTDIEDAIERTTDVNATYSAATFRPPVPQGSSLSSQMQRRLTIKGWEKDVGMLEDANLLRQFKDENLWRISLRVAALNDIDYGSFLNGITRNVSKQLEHLDTAGVSAELTGAIPLVYKAQRQILYDLLKSFVAAFIFISLVLIFILRDVRAGLVAMIPNVFPPLIVFGIMGWLGVPIEIGSVMTASVALGISVDDTIHFLTWYQRATRAGKSSYKAIQYAFEHCAKAMIDTTMICGLGVFPFLFSVFMPTVRFSRLLLILLMTALVGDLIVLPAILAGPAGKLFRLTFRPSRKSGSPVSESSPVIGSSGKPHAFKRSGVSEKR